MKSLGFRLIAALIVGITVVSTLSSWYGVQREKDELRLDLEHKAETFSEGLTGNAEPLLRNGDRDSMTRLVEQFGNRGQLLGLAIVDPQGTPVAVTRSIASYLRPAGAQLQAALHANKTISAYTRIRFRRVYLVVAPLHRADKSVAGAMMLVYDTGFIRAATLRVWGQALIHFGFQVLIIAGITVLIVRWSLMRPIASAARWMHALRLGGEESAPPMGDLDFLAPLANEVAPLIASVHEARAAAAAEARLRNDREQIWTAQRLADNVKTKLAGSHLYVVSNREPYIHSRGPQGITVSVPASGLVTAIEPILCACNGTWVAHGSGSADRLTVDAHDRLPVPPQEPRYTLRRVWLTGEEEQGYYYGFANEGLWPLCHIAHTRPTFRAADWEQYMRVNEKFADALVEEIGDDAHPVVLIQDYHFALLPRLLKERLPYARVAIFWHIPWPNPESFGICPWQRELVEGLLGADLIGFHVQAHCNNFLDTVDRALEARVDWERFSVKRNDHWSAVRPIPISVDIPLDDHAVEDKQSEDYRRLLKQEWNFEASWLAVGVDRMDYTKGILERFQAVESLLDNHSQYVGEFTLVQVGAPTRSTIPRYDELQMELVREAERINTRFRRGNWRPILLIREQQEHSQLLRFYRAAHVCLVTSLHDGMNLVAKEFVAARRDERGVLLLSRFTGAARELRDAILVNPYDTYSTGEAIAQALGMESAEMTDRMRRMRHWIKEHNIYWWASSLLSALCDLRIEPGVETKSSQIEQAVS